MTTKKKILFGILVVAILIIFILGIILFCIWWGSDRGPVASFFNKILDEKYCEKQEDCVISAYSKKECCLSCAADVVNKVETEKRELWRKIRCRNTTCPTLAEYACFGLAVVEPACVNNKCVNKGQAKATSSNKILALLTSVPAEYRNFADRYVALSSFDITTEEEVELTRWAVCEATVMLSPDKNKVAYFVTLNDQCEKEYYEGGYTSRRDLWIYDISDNERQLAVQSVWEFTIPKWSADGRYIAYERVIEHPLPQGREHILLIYDTQKKTEQSLGSFFGIVHDILGFSEDNGAVYYDDGQSVYKVAIANQDRETIYTHEQGFAHSFLVSPDGSSIAVFKEDMDWYAGKITFLGTKIGVIETSSGEYRELYSGTDHPLSLFYYPSEYEKRPVFLPDNSRVVYGGAGKEQGTGLWIIDITTGERKELGGIPSLIVHQIVPIALSGDGDLVLYSGWAAEKTYYYTLSLSTGEIKEIENTSSALHLGEVQERFLDWLN